MKKYILILFILSFIGLNAQSGWEIFNSYQKQKLIVPELMKLQISTDNSYYYTYQKNGMIKKWNMQTGILSDSIMLNAVPQFFFFSIDGSSAIMIDIIISTDTLCSLTIIDLEKMETYKTISFVPKLVNLIVDFGYLQMESFSISLLDFVKERNEVLISYKGNHKNISMPYESNLQTGRSIICQIISDTLKNKVIFSNTQLKYFKKIDDYYYFIEFGSSSKTKVPSPGYNSYGIGNEAFKFNSKSLESKKLGGYIYTEFSDKNEASKSGEMRWINEIFPTDDPDIFLFKLDNNYFKKSMVLNKFIDTIRLESGYSNDILMQNKRNLICQSADFRIYNLFTNTNIYTLDCPINPVAFRLFTDNKRVISWNSLGEVVLQNIFPNKEFCSITANKYFENPNNKIKFAYIGEIEPISYEWNFGDGSTSNELNPTHQYAVSNNYIVKLKITDNGGKEYNIELSKPIVIKDKLKAEFTIKPYNQNSPSEVEFIDKSLGNPLSYKWITSQNDTSYLKKPIFKFNNPGYYSVKLIVENENQKDSIFKKDLLVFDLASVDTFHYVNTMILPNLGSYNYTILKQGLNFDILKIPNDTLMMYLYYKVETINSYYPDGKRIMYENSTYKMIDYNNFSSYYFTVRYDQIINYDNTHFIVISLDSTQLGFFNSNIKVLYPYKSQVQIRKISLFNDYIYATTSNSIIKLNNKLEFISQINLADTLLHVFNVNNDTISALVVRGDDIYTQVIKDNQIISEKNFLKKSDFSSDIIFKNIDSNFVLMSSKKINEKNIGYIEIYDKYGQLVISEYYSDAEKINDIDKTIDGNYFLKLNPVWKNEISLIILNKKFERLTKFKYNNYDNNYVHHHIMYYHDSLFVLAGYTIDKKTKLNIATAIVVKTNFVFPVPQIPIIIPINNRFNLYPNPSNDFINIQYLEGYSLGDSKIEIYDIMGVRLFVTDSMINQINIQSLNTGIYFLKIGDNILSFMKY